MRFSAFISYCLVCFICIFIIAGFASGNTITHTQSPKNKKMPSIIVFSASKGDVIFNHELHLEAMKSEGCIPCHRTNTPKAGDIKTRFDERVAHYFCRGCHRDKEQGPTECHQCHKGKK